VTPLGKRLLPLLACLFLLGVAFDHWRSDRAEATERDALAESVPELVELRATNRWLRGQVRLQQQAAAETEPAAAVPEPTGEVALAPVRDMIGLIQSGLLGEVRWPFIAMISPDSTAAFAGPPPAYFETHLEYLGRLLALSEAQMSEFRRAAEEGLRDFTDAIAADAQVTRNDDGSVVISLPDLSRARGAYNRMLESFSGILGEERFGYFEAVGARSAFDDAFQRFGLNGKDLTVWWGRAGPGDREMLLYRQGATGISGVLTREAMRVNVGPLESLLPEDF